VDTVRPAARAAEDGIGFHLKSGKGLREQRQSEAVMPSKDRYVVNSHRPNVSALKLWKRSLWQI
jgi:hypothetical protein